MEPWVEAINHSLVNKSSRPEYEFKEEKVSIPSSTRYKEEEKESNNPTTVSSTPENLFKEEKIIIPSSTVFMGPWEEAEESQSLTTTPFSRHVKMI